MKSLRLLPILATSALLAACGGGDDGSTSADTSGAADTVSASETLPPAPTDPAATGDTTAPVDPGMMFGVVDTFDLAVDSPSHLVGSVALTGLATADPFDVPRCLDSMGFLDVGYSVEDSTTTGLPFEDLNITADGIDGPGTYPATFSMSSPVGPPGGGFPFTEVFGAEGEVTLTTVGDPSGTISGTFTIADDGFGNPVTGSWSCTKVAPPS